jgi:hypothetical protein
MKGIGVKRKPIFISYAGERSAERRRIEVEESANLGPAERGKTSRGFGEDGAKMRAAARASVKT